MKGRKERGFTLLELLIVVAIILIITAIALPKFLQARAAAAETAGAATLRNISTALAAYNTRWGSFPATAGQLGGTCNATTPATAALACVLDNVTAINIGTNPVAGYNFTYTQVSGGADFTLLADPAPGNNAQRHYYVDAGLTIHANSTGTSGPTDPTL